MHSDMCTQQVLKSACASAQYDQSFRCPHEETLHHLAIQNAPSGDSDQFMYDSDLWYTVEVVYCRIVWLLSVRILSDRKFVVWTEIL